MLKYMFLMLVGFQVSAAVSTTIRDIDPYATETTYTSFLNEGALTVNCQNHPSAVAKDIVYADNGELVSFTCVNIQYLCSLENPVNPKPEGEIN